jgi:hypothetical protein
MDATMSSVHVTRTSIPRRHAQIVYLQVTFQRPSPMLAKQTLLQRYVSRRPSSAKLRRSFSPSPRATLSATQWALSAPQTLGLKSRHCSIACDKRQGV